MRRVGLRDLVALAIGRRLRIRVSGRSMEPTLTDGTTVLVKPGSAQVGDVVLVKSEGAPILKRVDHVKPDGRLFLVGDGHASTDSRDFGPIAPERVIGRVVCTFP